MTAYERTNWRDVELSKRHRTWGALVPFCDVDLIVTAQNLDDESVGADVWLEFGTGEACNCPDDCVFHDPVLAVEFKYVEADRLGVFRDEWVDDNHRARLQLARRADLPYIIVTYTRPPRAAMWQFHIWPQSTAGGLIEEAADGPLSEIEWVRYLLGARGRGLDITSDLGRSLARRSA